MKMNLPSLEDQQGLALTNIITETKKIHGSSDGTSRWRCPCCSEGQLEVHHRPNGKTSGFCDNHQCRTQWFDR